jgi:itaconyl-CoA hydratase
MTRPGQDGEPLQVSKDWRGRFFEDFSVGDVYTSRLGRTVTEADNVWFTCLTLNTNQMHFNDSYASGTAFKRPLVNSTFTLALVTGLTVPDTSENGAANLEWTDIRLPRPVFVGDTLWAQSEVLALRESASRPQMGVVTVRSRGINQNGEVVIEFRRAFLAYKRDAPEVQRRAPATDEPWSVGAA